MSVEHKAGQFGGFEASTAPSPVYFSPTHNPLNKTRATWGNAQCAFSQVFKFLTGKDTERCGRSERPAEACENCQKITPFFMRLEWTREVPADAVASLGALSSQAFLLPDGCRLLVFTSDTEAKASAWASSNYTHGPKYVFRNQQEQQAVCFHCCRVCRRCEIKPVAGTDPSLFCKKGDVHRDPSLAKREHDKRSFDTADIARSSRGFGRPEPCRFVFNESSFPVNVRLPAGVLARKDKTGQISYLVQDDIVCFFDDVLMPFRIENGQCVVEIHRNPFEKLYRPNEYDNLAITVAVYRKGGRVPTPGLVLATPSTGGQEFKSSSPQDGSAQGDIIYKSTFRFYMRSPELGDGASDSESDEDDQAYPRGVVAKRRYHMAEHLQLAMTFKGQEAFYTVIQGYLRGGFCSTPQDRATEKLKRNMLFTDVMKQDVAAARKFVSEMLVEVGLYYMKHCKEEQDFRDGLLQLLDFAHALGAVGLRPFQTIVKDGPLLANKKSMCFRFPRKFGNEVRNVLVTAMSTGEVGEMIEGDPSAHGSKAHQDNNKDELAADFDVQAFAKLTLHDEPTQQEEALLAQFYPATGLRGGSQDDVKDLVDPEINTNLVKCMPTEFKGSAEQIASFSHAVANYPMSFKMDKETAMTVFNSVQQAVWLAGYQAPTNAQGEPVSEVTKSYWTAGVQWACALWPIEFKGQAQNSINETQFVNTIGKWLNWKVYVEFGLMYPSRIRVSHLKKLFRLYTNNLTTDPKKPMAMATMGIVHFVQCILLFLTPNGLLRTEHKILSMHAPLSLYCAIDCIYDTLTQPQTDKWLALFRAAVSRPAAEAAWRAYKATEKKDEEVPFFLRLPEVRVENNIAFGLNLMQCFERKSEFTHMLLVIDVFNEQNVCRSEMLDAHGQAHDYLGDWLMGYLTGAPTDTHNHSGGRGKKKVRYMPRRKRYRAAALQCSE